MFHFLKQIVTGNEKWILYTNVEWKRSRNKWNEPPWITSKTGLRPNKVMLYTWWDGKGVLYYEFLLANQMINYKYCSQLKQWKAALNKNHLELVNSNLSLLQGIFPTQELNPGLPHCMQILYQLSHRGSPRILEWVAYLFSSGSSQPRNQTRMSCIAGRFLTN